MPMTVNYVQWVNEPLIDLTARFSVDKPYIYLGGGGFGQLYGKIRDFFTITVVPVKNVIIPNADAVAYLLDMASEVGSKTFAFVVLVKTDVISKIGDERLKEIAFKAILTHEFCHFIRYYEIFQDEGGEPTDLIYSKFKNRVSKGLTEQTALMDSDSQTIGDSHNFWGNRQIDSLSHYRYFLEDIRNFLQKHYIDKGEKTLIEFPLLYKNLVDIVTASYFK